MHFNGHRGSMAPTEDSPASVCTWGFFQARPLHFALYPLNRQCLFCQRTRMATFAILTGRFRGCRIIPRTMRFPANQNLRILRTSLILADCVGTNSSHFRICYLSASQQLDVFRKQKKARLRSLVHVLATVTDTDRSRIAQHQVNRQSPGQSLGSSTTATVSRWTVSRQRSQTVTDFTCVFE